MLRNLYKRAQQGAFEVKIKGALEARIELHLLVHKFAQRDSIKSGLEGALHVVLESRPNMT